MPYLNAKICASESLALTKQIADALATLTSSILGKKRELTSITIEYIEPNRWIVADTPVSSQEATTFYLEAHITEGTNTKDEKDRYVKDVYSSLQRILGELHPASYVIIKDVAADSWGYGGATQEFRIIKGKKL